MVGAGERNMNHRPPGPEPGGFESVTACTLRFECLADFGLGQGPLAHDAPFLSVYAHNGRGKRGACIARIEDERQAVAELLEDLPGVGAGRMAGQRFALVPVWARPRLR